MNILPPQAPQERSPEELAECMELAKRFLVTERDEDDEPFLQQYATVFTEEALNVTPVPTEMVFRYFPRQSTSCIAAMGGAGKTTWLTWEIINGLMADTDAQVLVISAEDRPHDYHNKIYNLCKTHDHLTGKRYLEADFADIKDRIHILNLRGTGLKLAAQGSSRLSAHICSRYLRPQSGRFSKIYSIQSLTGAFKR